MRLDGKTALVTGGTQGVGAAIARSLAAAGCNVLLHGLRDDSTARATLDDCRNLGVRAELLLVDLAGPTDRCLNDLLQQMDSCNLPVQLLVNNVGTFREEPFLEMSLDTFERTFRLNVQIGFFLTQAFARRWIAQGIAGRVVFTGSINGMLAEPDHTAYDTSKGAVHSMVRSLCVALAPHGIRVNGIAPGMVVTPLTAPALQGNPQVMRWMELHTPSGEVPEADVCGPAVVFLLSDAARHIHGQTLFIDGGMSAWQQPDLPNGEPH